MSGICGICEPVGGVLSSSLSPMLSGLVMPGELGCSSACAKGAVFGVSRRWEFQQVTVSGSVLVAAEAELLNGSSLIAQLRASGVGGPLNSAAEIIAALYRWYGNSFVEKLEGAF